MIAACFEDLPPRMRIAGGVLNVVTAQADARVAGVAITQNERHRPQRMAWKTERCEDRECAEVAESRAITTRDIPSSNRSTSSAVKRSSADSLRATPSPAGASRPSVPITPSLRTSSAKYSTSGRISTADAVRIFNRVLRKGVQPRLANFFTGSSTVHSSALTAPEWSGSSRSSAWGGPAAGKTAGDNRILR